MDINLTTRLGKLELQSPIIVGSCPMTTDGMQRIAMISNGAGALVLPSITSSASAKEVQTYCEQIHRFSNDSSIPFIASVIANPSQVGWRDLLAKLQSSGARAIEISLQNCPGSIIDPREIEDKIVELLEDAETETDIPLFLKLTASYTSINYLAHRVRHCCQGLVMFGRTPIVDIELEDLSLRTHWGLTKSGSVTRSLESIMRTGSQCPGTSLIACGGIGTSQDFVKVLLAGASAAMVTSALYRDGVSVIGTLKDGLTQFMRQHNVFDIRELQRLCPSFEDIESDLKSCTYNSRVSSQDAAQSRGQAAAIQGDRFGHPTN